MSTDIKSAHRLLRQNRWSRIGAVAYNQWLALARYSHNWFDILVWPAVDVLLFGAIGVYVAKAQGSSTHLFAFMLAGIVLWHVVHISSVSLSKGFLGETWDRSVLNLLVTPISEAEFMCGVGLFTLVKLFMGFVFLIAMTWIAFSFNIFGVGFVIVPIFGLLLIVAFTLSVLVSGLMMRFGHGAEILVWGFLAAALPLSGVFYPINALPKFVRPIAEILPTSHAFTALRAVLNGQATPWGQLAIAYALALAMFGASLWFAARMLKVFRARGYITRYS